MLKRLGVAILVIAAALLAPACASERRERTHGTAAAHVRFFDDRDWTSGEFTATFVEHATFPPADQVIYASVRNTPSFQMSATIHPDGTTHVLIGAADGSDPKHAVTFRLPSRIQHSTKHTLLVKFVGWRIRAASLDGEPLLKSEPASVGIPES